MTLVDALEGRRLHRVPQLRQHVPGLRQRLRAEPGNRRHLTEADTSLLVLQPQHNSLPLHPRAMGGAHGAEEWKTVGAIGQAKGHSPMV